MSSIRVAAVAVLVLAICVAVGSVLPRDDSSMTIAPWALLLFLAVAIGDALAILLLTRGGVRGSIGLWLTLIGALAALTYAATPIWMVALVPGDGVFAMLDRLGMMTSILTPVGLVGAITLVFGWGIWGMPRLTARWRAG